MRRIVVMWIVMGAVACTEAQEQVGWRMPEVPEGLTQPQERADWIALHYWGGQKADAVTAEVLEQAFVDYLSALPYTSGETVQGEAMDSLVAHTTGISGQIAMLAEKYLYETESPMLDERLYRLFLESKLPGAGEAEQVRIRGVLEEIERCKPGSIAPDIEVKVDDMTRRGHPSPQAEDGTHPRRMMEIAAGGPAIVLFYDHDCEQCQETIAEMQGDTRLTTKLAEGAVRLIAVDVDLMADRTTKQQTPNWYWTSAVGDVEECYSIRSYPSIYVLSSDGTIIIKDSSYGPVSSAIQW